jgi:ribosomal protein L37AE/L43A
VIAECSCGETEKLEQFDEGIFRCQTCQEFFELDNFAPHNKRARKRKIRYEEDE